VIRPSALGALDKPEDRGATVKGKHQTEGDGEQVAGDHHEALDPAGGLGQSDDRANL